MFQAKINFVIAESRYIDALANIIPVSADRIYNLVEAFVVYFEVKKKSISQFSVSFTDRRRIKVLNKEKMYLKARRYFKYNRFIKFTNR